MSYRLKITLPDGANTRLQTLSVNCGEPVARIAANLVLRQIGYGTMHDENLTAKLTAGGRPSWIEAKDGTYPSRPSLHIAVERLCDRYPEHLDDLPSDWWDVDYCKETLCALATWRMQIDEVGKDPREELAFQSTLIDYTQILRSRPSGLDVQPQHSLPL
jgi:hypothetical protein